MSTQHTPGPWHTSIDSDGWQATVRDANDSIVCDAGFRCRGTEAEANAALIAAAPETAAERDRLREELAQVYEIRDRAGVQLANANHEIERLRVVNVELVAALRRVADHIRPMTDEGWPGEEVQSEELTAEIAACDAAIARA